MSKSEKKRTWTRTENPLNLNFSLSAATFYLKWQQKLRKRKKIFNLRLQKNRQKVEEKGRTSTERFRIWCGFGWNSGININHKCWQNKANCHLHKSCKTRMVRMDGQQVITTKPMACPVDRRKYYDVKERKREEYRNIKRDPWKFITVSITTSAPRC